MLVLYVEDNAMNSRVMKDMLLVAGVEMSEAPEAFSGLKMIGEHQYDLILMDLRMPGMDGVEAIQHIRARSDSKAAVPVIVVTADMGPDIRDDCMKAGADDVLRKPVAMNELFDSMGRVLASKSQSGTSLA